MGIYKSSKWYVATHSVGDDGNRPVLQTMCGRIATAQYYTTFGRT